MCVCICIKWPMNDCYDLYVNKLWFDMHEKYVIFELLWWNGQEPCMIHESIWSQMLTTLYDERYAVIMIMTKWWMMYAQWELYELYYSTLTVYWDSVNDSVTESEWKRQCYMIWKWYVIVLHDINMNVTVIICYICWSMLHGKYVYMCMYICICICDGVSTEFAAHPSQCFSRMLVV